MDTSTRRAVRRASGDLRRELVRSMALPVGSMAALGLTIALVPLRAHVARPALLVVVLVLVLATTLAGGRSSGLVCALVAGLGFDSFLTVPYGELRPDRLAFWSTTGALVLVVLAVTVLDQQRR